MAPLFLINSMIVAELRAILIVLDLDIEIPTTGEEVGKTGYGALLLMIAFIISSMILALGANLLGIDNVRIRAGISLTFFAFVFVALVVYDNLKRRWG